MIDFHCHLDLYPDPVRVARDCAARGMHVLSVTTTPSAWRGTCALAPAAARIRTALGLHPQLAHERSSELGLFEDYLPQARYVGEIGLDGSPEYRPYWSQQLLAFRHILDACQAAGGRVLSIHSRQSASAVIDQLQQRPGAGIAVLHWFSGSRKELDRAVSLGCWFSVGPAMLVGAKGRALASFMPRERILTESDGPFAQLNGRPAFPWDAEIAVRQLASLWQESEAAAAARLLGNLARLVGG